MASRSRRTRHQAVASETVQSIAPSTTAEDTAASDPTHQPPPRQRKARATASTSQSRPPAVPPQLTDHTPTLAVPPPARSSQGTLEQPTPATESIQHRPLVGALTSAPTAVLAANTTAHIAAGPSQDPTPVVARSEIAGPHSASLQPTAATLTNLQPSARAVENAAHRAALAPYMSTFRLDTTVRHSQTAIPPPIFAPAPLQVPAQRSRRGVHFDNDVDREDFTSEMDKVVGSDDDDDQWEDEEEDLPPTLGLPATPRRQNGMQNTRTPLRTPRTPQYGQNLTPRRNRTSMNVASPKRTCMMRYIPRKPRARDIARFYERKDDIQECVACRLSQKRGLINESEVKKYAATSSTTPLRQHLSIAHREEWLDFCRENDVTFSQKAIGRLKLPLDWMKRVNPIVDRSTIPKFSLAVLVDAIRDWLISDAQAIYSIENPLLRRIFLILHEGLTDDDIPHRSTMSRRIFDAYMEYIAFLSDRLSKAIGRISTTVDLWTDPHLTPYMAITGHCMERCKNESGQEVIMLRSYLIGFIQLPGSHTGEHICAAFLHVTDTLGISEKLGYITMDNASNNDAFMKHLEKIWTRRYNKPFRAKEQRIRCFPHILHIGVTTMLKVITNPDLAEPNCAFSSISPAPAAPPPGSASIYIERDPIALLRSGIRLIRTSSLRRQQYEAACKYKNIPFLELLRDVVTRWGSTFLMIDRYLDVKEAVDYVLTQLNASTYVLDDDELHMLKIIHEILEAPYVFQDHVSSETTPSLGRVIEGFAAVIRCWKEMLERMAEDRMFNVIWDVINTGLSKIEEYWEKIIDVPVYIWAILIDPAKGKQALRDHLGDYDVEEALSVFYNKLESYTPVIPSSEASHGAQPPTGGTGRPTKQRAAQLLRLRNVDTATVRNGEQPFRTGREEGEHFLNAYAGHPCDDLVAFYSSKTIEKTYPRVFRLAMDVLPAQGSSVPVERVFSSAKEIISDRRNRLGGDMMGALQMLRHKLRKDGTLGDPRKFTNWQPEEQLVGDMEAYWKVKEKASEDIQSYQASLRAGGVHLAGDGDLE